VDVQLEAVPSSARRVGVTFSGTGRLSQRPYRLGDELSIADAVRTQLDPTALKQDGGEPIDIHEMSVWCGAPINNNDLAGDIQQLRIGCRQTGNGTNQQWEVGPVAVAPGANPLCPAGLWGATTGRAIVHEFPVASDGERGWLWQPGQGVTVELRDFDTVRLATVTETVWVAMAGYAILT
jgi:hypothetical protein